MDCILYCHSSDSPTAPEQQTVWQPSWERSSHQDVIEVLARALEHVSHSAPMH